MPDEIDLSPDELELMREYLKEYSIIVDECGNIIVNDIIGPRLNINNPCLVGINFADAEFPMKLKTRIRYCVRRHCGECRYA